MPSIKGFLQKTEPKTGAKLFRGLQEQWRSSGAAEMMLCGS
jgi:hypothetical protein